MFEFITGTLRAKDPARAIVEAAGIGYRLSIPLRTYSQLPPLGSPVHLFLSHIVREDSESLYAFFHLEERELFETLLNISGIGPKTALAIIGHIELSAFQRAIAAADHRLLSKIPGIGKKTAERLVIEMRDKFKLKATPLAAGGLLGDALSALCNLGYKADHAQKALEEALSAAPDADLSTLITSALQKI